MRKTTISSMIVIATILLSACSSPTALFQNGAANTNNTAPETEGGATCTANHLCQTGRPGYRAGTSGFRSQLHYWRHMKAIDLSL